MLCLHVSYSQEWDSMKLEWWVASPGCTGLVHPSGWMTSNNFLSILQHFVKNVRCSLDHKVLLILDTHESHLSINAITYAKENGIIILTLPPHTSSKLQPLDGTVYGPFKTFYHQGLNTLMLQHPGRPATIYDLAPIMSSAWDRAATPVNIKSGFHSTGICPYDTGVFTDADFAGAFVTDRPVPNPTAATTSQEVTCQQNTMTQPVSPTSLIYWWPHTPGQPQVLEPMQSYEPSFSLPTVELKEGKETLTVGLPLNEPGTSGYRPS